MSISLTRILISPVCLISKFLPNSSLKDNIQSFCAKKTEPKLKTMHQTEDDYERIAQNIEKLIAENKSRIWFFDLDGTLVDEYGKDGSKLASEHRFKSPAMVNALSKIAKSPMDTVVFISGRYLDYLLKQIQGSLEKAGMPKDSLESPNTHYIGSYGIEIDKAADPELYDPMVKRLKEIFSKKMGIEIKTYMSLAEAQNDGFPEIWFKVKPTGVVIHCEKCLKDKASLEKIHKAAEETVKEFNAESEIKFIKYSGTPEVIDLKPVASNKGLAFEEMIRRYPDAVAIGAGNENADLEFLRKIKAPGVAIFIGNKQEDKQILNLNNVNRMEELLQRISRRL